MKEPHIGELLTMPEHEFVKWFIVQEDPENALSVLGMRIENNKRMAYLAAGGYEGAVRRRVQAEQGDIKNLPDEEEECMDTNEAQDVLSRFTLKGQK